ncbi:MAG TPA: His-Xaa-Ser system protein HxsD, partial [Arachidicoccus sp.]|nr:His-Xaa-Ser system protein HxsD [Arachidicoccus sp.]
ELYSEDVIFKCFYWYGDTFHVDISSQSKKEYAILLTPKNDIDYDLIIGKIKTDLIDFKLRDIVSKETKTIRELIIAKAFAYYEEDQSPDTEISDPVGFNPENFE